MTPALHLEAVHKRYGDVAALAGLDLTVEPGELVAVLGPNGAGKTTTFELLLGLVRPTTGRVEVFGAEPGSTATQLRTGAMLQSAGLPEQVTVRELVTLIGAAYPSSLPTNEALERAGLGARAGRTVTALSGGERQRLLLAMAIVGRPDLLLLDEPTAAMDVASKHAFWEQADGIVRGGATVVFATHDLAEADQVAERVVVMRGGRIVADATPAELKALVSNKTVTVVTDAPVDTLRHHAGVDRVTSAETAGADGLAKVVVHGDQPALLIHDLVRDGWRVADLTVADADLEQAFLHLTNADEPDAAAPATPAAEATTLEVTR